MDIKSIVEKNDTLVGRIFDLSLQSLILISIVTFSIETLPNLKQSTLKLLNITEAVIVSIFTIEYLLRLYVADKKLSYIFSFYGLIDLIAIIPFYISAGIDLRSLRVFRLFRLAQSFKLIRYSKAMRRFTQAFMMAKEEFILFGILTLMLLYLSAVGIYYFEHIAQPEAFKSIFHSLWWGVTTLTTVGYGDVYPVTLGGRIFTFFILIIGLGIVAIPAGIIASSLSQTRKSKYD